MIDYSKPGKTAPGTQHPRPARRERRTWLDIVAPHRDHVPAGDRAEDVQYPVMARKQRRLEKAHRDRRQRKGQRAFYAAQLERQRRDEIARGQMRVLQLGPDAPGNAHRYRNVVNGLGNKYGAEIDEILAAAQA